MGAGTDVGIATIVDMIHSMTGATTGQYFYYPGYVHFHFLFLKIALSIVILCRYHNSPIDIRAHILAAGLMI